MKITRLYLKIFIAFVAVLVAAEAVVFAIVLTNKMHPPFFRDAVDRIKVVDMLVGREIGQDSAMTEATRQRVEALLGALASGFRSSIWLTDDRERLVAASFDGPVPDIWDSMVPVDLPTPKGVHFFLVENRETRSVYLDSDIVLKDGTRFAVHVLYGKHPPREAEWFLKGLVLLTCLGALFIIPVSRRITKPILKLAETAERLGQGDFSQRVDDRGHDEVSVLAHKFNRMAGRLEKMVTSGKELTAHLSHELRSPLARLRISLQMIMERAESGLVVDNTKLLSAMRDEIEHMDDLIGKMLDLSKLELRGPQPRQDSLDLLDLVRELLDHYEPMLQSRGIELVTEFETAPVLLCHAIAIKSLMDNVIGNAIKYTGDRGAVFVSLRAEGPALVARICNVHAPLTDEELTSMFIPFHRLGRGNEAGTGLGLAAARGIAAMHEGSIEAANVPVGIAQGRWTLGAVDGAQAVRNCVCFTITLPLA
jgi:two-component system sensor histidine kinase CpxA